MELQHPLDKLILRSLIDEFSPAKRLAPRSFATAQDDSAISNREGEKLRKQVSMLGKHGQNKLCKVVWKSIFP